MSIKLKTLLAQSLHEQIDKKRVQRAYDQTVKAVSGVGTDTNAVLAAIKMLRNRYEFIEYMLKFQDKKTGYSKFPEMINAEYDRFNYDDVQKIVAALYNLRVSSVINKKGTGDFAGMNFFDSFEIRMSDIPTLFTKKDRYNIKKQWLTELPKAVAFWKSWLSDPITKQRVQQNWDAWYADGKFQVKLIWPKYFNILDKLYIKFYDINSPEYEDAYAYITGNILGPKPIIFVNLDYNAPEKYDILVHEIQHVIYDIKPLNPENKISNAFVTKNTKPNTPDIIKSSIVSSAVKKLNPILSKATSIITSLGLDMTPKELLVWRQRAKAAQPGDPGYVCRATEKMSNIMATRTHFKLKPGQNITAAMLKPYIEGKKENTDISWLLFCWAYNNFPDLNTMLNRINMLAKNDTNTTNKKGSSNLA